MNLHSITQVPTVEQDEMWLTAVSGDVPGALRTGSAVRNVRSTRLLAPELGCIYHRIRFTGMAVQASRGRVLHPCAHLCIGF